METHRWGMTGATGDVMARKVPSNSDRSAFGERTLAGLGLSVIPSCCRWYCGEDIRHIQSGAGVNDRLR